MQSGPGRIRRHTGFTLLQEFFETLSQAFATPRPSHFGLELSLTNAGPLFGVQMDSLQYRNFEDQERGNGLLSFSPRPISLLNKGNKLVCY